jgi:Na+/proline symporter/signal transduction histidine kinase
MLTGGIIVLASFAYVGLLFAIAYYGDKRADAGRSIIANPYIYALSLAVYCTSWTFYGSVGRAATSGIGFLPIYLGPTLMAALWWYVLLKIIRVSKANRITSIADFIASRYGKTQMLGGLVTVIAVIGVIPYIALQLKAISTSFSIILQYPEVAMPDKASAPLFGDNTFYIAMLLAAFTILFGTRHLDATERHEGLVAAVAFESLVKLLAFLAVGIFVTFVMYDGFGDIFRRAKDVPQLNTLVVAGGAAGNYMTWASLTLLSMCAVMFLPRQFQVAVVENVDERHLNKAIWLFPLYLLAINVFVLPIALGGLMHFSAGGIDADTFVLTLPMAEQQPWLALFAFIGGLSAATGMVIVETIALSTMVCNDLLMPVLLRLKALRLTARRDLSGLLLGIRRLAIIGILVLGYLYFYLAGEAYALVSIGLISFSAVAQFAPAIIGGLFWRGGTRLGATCGLAAGFLVWVYTLLLPSFAKSGWLPITFLYEGLLGLDGLKPQQLFGLQEMDEVTHCLFWSMIANIGCYVGASLLRRPSAAEHSQAMLFVDVLNQKTVATGSQFWRGSASVTELLALLGRFVGPDRAREAFTAYARTCGAASIEALPADADLVHHTESLLAGAIGSSSARVMIASVVDEEPLGLDEVMNIIDEASQVLAYSRQLEQKSRELETATNELIGANRRLQELDRLKDDFISTVTHELRTPLTSIRAFSEILNDNPQLESSQREKFLGIIIKESERLTRLINQVLDLAKIESGNAEWHANELDLREVIDDSLTAVSQLFKERNITLEVAAPEHVPTLVADRDRLMQVMLNLLSNAAKFCGPQNGRVRVTLEHEERGLRVDVTDNGSGISAADQALIFEKFRQAGDTLTQKPPGSGLGLAISREIIGHFGGHLWVASEPGIGSTFSFTIPLAPAAHPDEGAPLHAARRAA